MELSVVIPVYNEEENIEAAINDVITHFPKAQIIIVDDCSTDNTFKIVSNIMHKKPNVGLLIHHIENKGHGQSVVDGLSKAQGDYILYIDADRQINLSNANNLAAFDGFDFVSGYRVDRHDKPFRLFITRVLKYTNLLRHGYFIRDANCPFKIYKRESLKPLLNQLPESMVIPIACLEVLARRAGLNTMEMPTYHKAYEGNRQGFLQSINRKSIAFCWRAFLEVMKL